MPCNYEPDLGVKAAPRLAHPEVSFKPGGHCAHDDIQRASATVNMHDGSLDGSGTEPGSIGQESDALTTRPPRPLLLLLHKNSHTFKIIIYYKQNIT